MYCKVLFCIAFIVLCSFANSQDCGQKFASFKTCVKNQIETADKQPNPQVATLKTGVDNCYKTAKCTSTGDDDDDDDDDADQAQRQKRQECRRAYRAEAQKQIEACVKASFPQFSIPQRPQSKGLPKEGRHLAPKRLDDACKNGGDKNQAQQCLKNLFTANKPSDADLKQKFDAVCAKVNDCKKELTGCEAKIDEVKTKICQCAKDTHAKAATIRQGITQCAGLPDTAGQKGGNIGDKNCQEIQSDPCEQGFDAFKQKRGN